MNYAASTFARGLASGLVARSFLPLRLIDSFLVSITEFCVTESDDNFVERAGKLERNVVIFAHGCAGVFAEVERLVCGDAKRNGAGNIPEATSLPSTSSIAVPPLPMPGPSYLKSTTMVCLPGARLSWPATVVRWTPTRL